MDKKQAHLTDIQNKLGDFDTRVTLTLLGTTDLELAKLFATEFKDELTKKDKLIATTPGEKDLALKARLLRFSKMANLFTSLRGVLLQKSKEGLFIDDIKGSTQKVHNQEFYTQEIISNKSKILTYVSKSLGRCQFLYEFFLTVNPKDELIQEVIKNLENWINIFNEFSSSLLKNSPSEFNEYLINVNKNKENLKRIILKMLEKANGQFGKDEVVAVLNFLSPEYGKEISIKLIDEFIETSITLNTVRILGRLSGDSNPKNSQEQNEFLNPIDLLTAKNNALNLYNEAKKVKVDKNLSVEQKESNLNDIDERLLRVLIPILNKISVIFPHKDLKSGGTVVEILADENAICTGKSQIVRLILEYLTIRDSQYGFSRQVVEGNEDFHTFNLFKLPSGNKGIIDCNSNVYPEKRGNKISVRVMKEFANPDDFDESVHALVFDQNIGKFRYYEFLDNEFCYTFITHRDFQISKSNQSLPTSVITNFISNKTLLKFDSYLKGIFPDFLYITPELETYLYTKYCLENLQREFKLDESAFVYLLSGNGYNSHNLANLVLCTSLESLKNYKDATLLNTIYSFLEKLSIENPKIFLINKYYEKDKYEYLKQKLGKV